MSILIPMDMPDSCDECYFRNIGECDLGSEFITHAHRPGGCPLIEVKAPKRIMSKDDLEAAGFET